MPPKRGKWPPAVKNSARPRPGAARAKFRDRHIASPPSQVASNGFSMRDAARNTASHQSSMAWVGGDARLREKPVTFVSAGFIEPLKELNMRPAPVSNPAEEANNNDVGTPDDGAAAAYTESTAAEASDPVEAVEQEDKATAELVDAPAEAQGGETEELFFFDLTGDETIQCNHISPPEIPSPRSSLDASDSSEEVILFKGRAPNARVAATQETGRAEPKPPSVVSTTTVQRTLEVSATTSNAPSSRDEAPPAQALRKRSRRKHRSSRGPMAEENGDDEDEILADYIANMAANSEDDFLTGQLQASSGYRDLGGEHDAFKFGSGEDSLGEEAESASSDDSGAGDDSAEDDEGQDTDADMDDETLARLLSKQELAIGGDELMLFDSAFAEAGTKNKRRANRRAPASASQVADAFDDLDLADWSPPLGQPCRRRSKQPPNFNVSDSEIEAVLKGAWQRDRERKKARKLEREALRAQGLLGKNANPDDLRVKYPTGMKLDDIKAELTSFLLGSAARLAFPPLDKHARKILHEIAGKFNIKSKSTGNGDQRHPVFQRTKRTIRYASTNVADATNHVDQATMRIHRKYFHRVDVKIKRTGTPRTGGRSVHKALLLRDGEVVGASVPELGQDNKGRAMLEKMGWSKGMALGAEENKGILEPLAQVVKRTKAGLG